MLSLAVLSVRERPPCRSVDVLRPYLPEMSWLRSTIVNLRRTVGLDGDDAVIAYVRPARDSIR